jgi:ABC-2 type transport system permease protein
VTADALTAAETRGNGSVRRIASLGRAEAVLLRRNTLALLIALAVPVGSVLVLRSSSPEPGGAAGGGSGAAIVMTLTAVTLNLVVYYNLVTALVARREDLVLKRLRAGETGDAEILAGTAAPAVAIAWAQIGLGGVAAAALFGMAAPVNVVLLAAALVLGTAAFVLLAAVTAAVTRSVEMAQVTTLPVLFVPLNLSGLYIPLGELPGPLEQFARVLPLTPVVDLLRLGLAGTAQDGHTVDLAGSFGAATPPLLVLLVWVAACGWATRRWFRWEPRR